MRYIGISIFSGCFESVRQYGETTKKCSKYSYRYLYAQKWFFKDFQYIFIQLLQGAISLLQNDTEPFYHLKFHEAQVQRLRILALRKGTSDGSNIR